jgi:hypothetical protein
LSREDGEVLINQYEGKEPRSLDIFLEFVGLTKEEFYEITKSHTVSPWKMSLFENELGDMLPDYDQWSKEGKMKRENALEQLERWRKSATE